MIITINSAADGSTAQEKVDSKQFFSSAQVEDLFLAFVNSNGLASGTIESFGDLVDSKGKPLTQPEKGLFIEAFSASLERQRDALLSMPEDSANRFVRQIAEECLDDLRFRDGGVEKPPQRHQCPDSYPDFSPLPGGGSGSPLTEDELAALPKTPSNPFRPEEESQPL